MATLGIDARYIVGGGGWRFCVDCDEGTHLTDDKTRHRAECPQFEKDEE
ncbi:hypothetical protein QFZ53_002803 [Microbacterium natoriense]|uniref:Uncharacterized protein n=1 Tax=Microbacterium natoriense TaxID=284570 RepID=A0AAW8EZD3_9MICO|nr:hypothetical protein [Microbacterium natoriense]MDQ0648607.1 hypothetical protein [Microbacterium natoriense]